MARILETTELKNLREELPGLLINARNSKSQPSKQLVFAGFIQKVFGIKPEEFGAKMEIPITSKVLLVRGRIDTVFGNLIIEFKVNLDKELDDAKDELKKYFQAMKEKFPRTNFLGMATDDLKFKVYKPVIDDSGNVQAIEEMDYLNLEQQKDVEKIFLWFDSYLFTSERIPPSSDDLKRRFGAESPTFSFMKDKLTRLFNKVAQEPTIKTKRNNWEKYLEIVYGEKVAGDELFMMHTYLATLAKIMVFLHINKGKLPSRGQLSAILDGKVFDDFGITNFIEEDFFAWILFPSIINDLNDSVMRLLTELVVYDLGELNEDVFKELYQELVDPVVRHGLGEYYTPDWLAEFILKDKVSKNPDASILDPSCGSGTFLFTAIRLIISEMKSRGKSPAQILSHILNNIMGIDIHPLAVIVSRTNYLLALKELLAERKEPISIPVYLSDSIKLPEFISEVKQNRNVYRIEAVDNSFFMVPEKIANKPSAFDDAINDMHRYAKRYESRELDKQSTLQSFSNSISNKKDLDTSDMRVFKHDMDTLLDLIDHKSNAIWTFLLRNIYRPISLSQRKFDLVVGNPPWIAMNVMKNPNYQAFLKESSIKFGLVNRRSPHLVTHMEIATLFYLTSVQLYLKKTGTISFVMPASVIKGDQHALFRASRFNGIKIGFKKLIDLSKVEPLFTDISCVIESSNESKTKYPISGVLCSGKLSRKNATFEEASAQLKFEDTKFNLVSTENRNFLQEVNLASKVSFYRSSYFDKFREGAILVPRPFWFVGVVRHPVLGASLNQPFVRTSVRAKMKGKKQYADVDFEGQIESKFLYATVTGSEMIPFGLISRNLTVLPIEEAADKYRIVSKEEAEIRGFHHLAKWMGNVEKTWISKRGSKAGGSSIYQWIDHWHKLTDQSSKKRYAVVYESVGTYLVASVIDRKDYVISTSEGNLRTSGTLIDYSTIYYETSSREEAEYLCSVFNSKIMDDLIKPMQAGGQQGPRNIWKKTLELPIPEFDPDNKTHRRLAELGKICSKKVQSLLPSYVDQHNIGKIRSLVRDSLADELHEITDLVSDMLKVAGRGKPRLAKYTDTN